MGIDVSAKDSPKDNHPKDNQLIVDAAWEAAIGKMPGAQMDPGKCLAFVRVIVEWAIFMGEREFYNHTLVAGTTSRPGTDKARLEAAWRDPWAADIERSVKVLGWSVPWRDRQPGDLWFNYRKAAPVGHVGILIDQNTVIENINPKYRPKSVHLPGNISLTPVTPYSHTLLARPFGF